jgi:hypothetical protein
VSVVPPPGKVPLGPTLGATNVTRTFGETAFAESRTIARRFVANCVFTTALWGVPVPVVIVPGAVAVFVKLKGAIVADADAAFTTYGPATPFAVNGSAVATPSDNVMAVLIALLNVPLGPTVGGVHVIVSPAMELLNESTTDA